MPERKIQMNFRVSEEEEQLIRKRMEECGIISIGAYLRKMAIDGYCICLDMSDVKEALRLLRINSNNINQYTKKANETGRVYIEDIKHLQASQEEIWGVMKNILVKLSELS